MADSYIVLNAKVSAGVRALRFWIMPTSVSNRPKSIVLNAKLRGKVLLSTDTDYFVYYQFFGNPGDALSFTCVDPNGQVVVEVEDETIEEGSYQAGVRELRL